MQHYISIVHDMRVRPPDERRIRRNGQHIDARLAQQARPLTPHETGRFGIGIYHPGGPRPNNLFGTGVEAGELHRTDYSVGGLQGGICLCRTGLLRGCRFRKRRFSSLFRLRTSISFLSEVSEASFKRPQKTLSNFKSYYAA